MSMLMSVQQAAEKVQNEFPTKIRFGAINSRVFDELADPFGMIYM